ncbi:MAG TPA: nuclear transport factor 2 family protein [Solirubrobacteraceae bacterium]|nr:nuclear transport factor 2 family protein [Solirubrobacteraceae bacterium]HUB74936.1 nuclear transport factor 2 family protein [Solirubrobacteraceae bacterium]
MPTMQKFQIETFTRAVEERDAATQLAMYAPDAEVTLIDRVSQPSAPRVLLGVQEVRAWLEDVCGRDMSHRVRHTVCDRTGAAFTESCRYPDGTAVECATVLELADGLVKRQTVVQAWDE